MRKLTHIFIRINRAAIKLAGKEKRCKKETQVFREYGGPKGPEPTRYKDWQHNGRVTDF
jgi:hypothetical protein